MESLLRYRKNYSEHSGIKQKRQLHLRKQIFSSLCRMEVNTFELSEAITNLMHKFWSHTDVTLLRHSVTSFRTVNSLTLGTGLANLAQLWINCLRWVTRSNFELVVSGWLEENGSVDEHPANEAAHLLHVRQLGPPVRFGVIALDGAEDGLVLTEAAANVDLALVGDHGAPEPRLVHRGHGAPCVASRTVTFN